MIEPNLINGIGYCSGDGCPKYDGKRCRLLGFRPQSICEPWVCGLVAEVKSLKKQLREVSYELKSRDFDNCMFGKGKYD